MEPSCENPPNGLDNVQVQISKHSNSANNPPSSSNPPKPTFTIKPVQTPSDLEATIILFTAYVKSLGIDLSFQDFQTEMASMPGKYSPSAGGQLLLARSVSTDTATATATSTSTTSNLDSNTDAGTAIGCVALRALPDTTSTPTPTQRICEMKRLYVNPQARNLGLGRALAREIITTARDLGYDEMRLDTLPTMGAAQAMYRDFGFVDIEPYCFNPVEGTRFLGLRLR